MTIRADHYGIAQYLGGGTFASKAQERDFHARFTIAYKDFRGDVGTATLEGFYGERNRDGSAKSNGWIWQQCTGIESEVPPKAIRFK